ncbi:hypothetical protein C0J52_08132 [Blattella germanica]|nr:hypothetical protein C0J52_08132 [Blattella germanica]
MVILWHSPYHKCVLFDTGKLFLLSKLSTSGNLFFTACGDHPSLRRALYFPRNDLGTKPLWDRRYSNGNFTTPAFKRVCFMTVFMRKECQLIVDILRNDLSKENKLNIKPFLTSYFFHFDLLTIAANLTNGPLRGKETDVVTYIKLKRLEWAGHVCRMGYQRKNKRIVEGWKYGRKPVGRPKDRWIDQGYEAAIG